MRCKPALASIASASRTLAATFAVPSAQAGHSVSAVQTPPAIWLLPAHGGVVPPPDIRFQLDLTVLVKRLFGRLHERLAHIPHAALIAVLLGLPRVHPRCHDPAHFDDG